MKVVNSRSSHVPTKVIIKTWFRKLINVIIIF